MVLASLSLAYLLDQRVWLEGHRPNFLVVEHANHFRIQAQVGPIARPYALILFLNDVARLCMGLGGRTHGRAKTP